MENKGALHVNQDYNHYFDIILCKNGHGLSEIANNYKQIKIIHLLRGQLTLEINTMKNTLMPGDIFIILSDEKYSISSPSIGDTAFWLIMYDKDVLLFNSNTLTDNQFLFLFTASGTIGKRKFSRDELVESKIMLLLDEILNEFEAGEFCADIAICLDLCQLSLCLMRIWKSQDTDKQLMAINDIYSINLLQQIFNFVDKEYMGKIKMETIANQCNMSYHTFSKFFISHTGKTFPSYVNEVRMTKSKILLTTTGMNITEIAMAVGYNSSSHYIQLFKESNQMTPQQFRKEFNK